MIFRVSPRPAGELTAADGAIVVSLPVTTGPPSSNDVAPLPSSGVYPFEVQVFDGTSDVPVATLVTTLLRLGAPDEVSASNTLAVGVVVPVQADAVPGLDGSPTLDDAGAESLTTTIDLTALRTAVPLTVAPSPESIQLLDSRDPAGEATVAGLRAGPTRTVLGAPYAPVDSGSWLDSGMLAELDDQYVAGNTTLLGLLRIAARRTPRRARPHREPGRPRPPPHPWRRGRRRPVGPALPAVERHHHQHLHVAVRARRRRRPEPAGRRRRRRHGRPPHPGRRPRAGRAPGPGRARLPPVRRRRRLPRHRRPRARAAHPPPPSPPSSTGSPTPPAPTASTASPPASPCSAP